VAGAAAAATLACADGDTAAGWSSPREQLLRIGVVDISTAEARISGSDLPFGLVNSFITDTPRRQLAAEYRIVEAVRSHLCSLDSVNAGLELKSDLGLIEQSRPLLNGLRALIPTSSRKRRYSLR
jgi:hypothetical protein